MNSNDRLHGLLIGTALGDSVGLPAEGLTPAQIQKLGWNQDWKQRFFFGRGMWSDDTEHTIILAQALLASNDDLAHFEKKLARGLKVWLLGIPAGVGLATARSLCKLWLGFPPNRSGVFSAGNGPAMRAAILGPYFYQNPKERREFNRAQTRLTHTDPKAEFASLAVAEVAAFFCREGRAPDQQEIVKLLSDISTDSEWQRLLEGISHHLQAQSSFPEFLTAIGGNPQKGISGYCYQTVPSAIFLGMKEDWHSETVLQSVWNAGGDTDTVGAIAGALCGCLRGPQSFPKRWSDRLAEWPTSLINLKQLASALDGKKQLKIRAALHPLLFIRNLLFLSTVLFHGFARVRLLFLRK